jgi:hypothetical protein
MSHWFLKFIHHLFLCGKLKPSVYVRVLARNAIYSLYLARLMDKERECYFHQCYNASVVWPLQEEAAQ